MIGQKAKSSQKPAVSLKAKFGGGLTIALDDDDEDDKKEEQKSEDKPEPTIEPAEENEEKEINEDDQDISNNVED